MGRGRERIPVLLRWRERSLNAKKNGAGGARRPSARNERRGRPFAIKGNPYVGAVGVEFSSMFFTIGHAPCAEQSAPGSQRPKDSPRGNATDIQPDGNVCRTQIPLRFCIFPREAPSSKQERYVPSEVSSPRFHKIHSPTVQNRCGAALFCFLMPERGIRRKRGPSAIFHGVLLNVVNLN